MEPRIALREGAQAYLDYFSSGSLDSLRKSEKLASQVAKTQPESGDAHFLLANILQTLGQNSDSVFLLGQSKYHFDEAARWKSNSGNPELLGLAKSQNYGIAPVRFISREKLENLFSSHPAAIFYDVSTRAPFAHNYSFVQSGSELSPFQPIGNIPIPGRDEFSDSVEGVWQGLKLVKGRIDPSFFVGKGRKRYGRVEGHLYKGKKIGYEEARRKIYVPTYEYMLSRPECSDLVTKMKQASLSGIQQFVFDVDYNPDIGNTKSPLAHSSVLANYINRLVQNL